MSTLQTILLVAIVGGLILVATGYVELPTFQAEPGGPLGPTPSCGFGLATFTADSRDKYTADPINVHYEVWDLNNNKRFNASGTDQVTVSSDAPTALAGYVMMGNDNHLGRGRSDLGSEYYFHKVDFSYGPCEGRFDLPEQEVVAETTPTWTGYDDQSAEATTNITVGSGETVTTLSIKVQAGADGCLGNPEIPNSFAVCFNVSNTALWDEIRPDNYVSKIPAPAYLDQYNILDDTCYVIGDAVCDYDSYKFDVVLDAAASQNPGTADYMYVFVLDKTYYIGDDQKWTQGWGMDSDLVTDTDIGVTSLGNEKAVWFT
ncbi:MAG: hypothetical protein ACTSW1_07965 [Candidatus Hodarchaeales archaeon]